MLGVGASEVIAVVRVAILGGLPHPLQGDAVLTDPTMAEGLNILLVAVPT